MRMAECHPDRKHRAKGLCNACYCRQWLDLNPFKREHLKGLNKANYYKYKQEMLNAYGNKCECCGEIEPAFLSLEHKKRNGQKHRNRLGSGFAIWLEIRSQGFSKEDYTLLCMNCQRGTLLLEGCPHKRSQN